MPNPGQQRLSRQDWRTRARRTCRYWYLRIIRQNASARNIALGLALGVFVGALPIIPFQTVVIVGLAFLFQTNKLSAWLATCYSNVFTLVPFYTFLFFIGKFVLPLEGAIFDPNKLSMSDLIAAGWEVFLVMTVGGLVFGIPAAVATYFVSLRVVRRYRQIRQEHRKRKLAQSEK
ncbi:MAG: DUF2062 domain-containing protein [Desulfovibrionaceae bacterium]